MDSKLDVLQITGGSHPQNGCFPGTSESSRIDLVSCLAQTILEGLEDMERESGLEEEKALPSEIVLEKQRLLGEIDALKARLKGLAQGV